MGLSDSPKSGNENALPVQSSVEETTEMTPMLSTALPPFGVEEAPAAKLLSIPIGMFYDKLPELLLTPKKPDLARFIYIASEDVVSDEETKEATILLSILSLSCPEIFARPIQSQDDVAITLPLDQLKPEPLERRLRTDLALDENAQFTTGASARPEGVVGSTGTATEAARKSDAAAASDEIRVRLEPILANLPPEIELSPILNGPQTEIALPLDLVKDQLSNGRVCIAATAFCALLPEDLKPVFGRIEPTAEIPIPLREIFRKLPSDTIKLREDYELGYSQEAIRTPFTVQAEEDDIRRGDKAEHPMRMPAEPDNKSTLHADEGAQGIADIAPPPTTEVDFPETFGSHALQALLMTEEVLDLPKTIQKVSELPGLRACLLSTTHGTMLGGQLADPAKERAILLALPRLFRQVTSTLAEMKIQSLEGMTLYCDRNPLSIFLVNDLCLIVLHDDRPFRPGVREKILAVMQELVKIGHTKKRS